MFGVHFWTSVFEIYSVYSHVLFKIYPWQNEFETVVSISFIVLEIKKMLCCNQWKIIDSLCNIFFNFQKVEEQTTNKGKKRKLDTSGSGKKEIPTKVRYTTVYYVIFIGIL